jgi:hypothetical protein
VSKNKLFVGGLSWDTNDDGLREAFAKFGSVSEAKVIMNPQTGRSKGFGFVTFATSDEAQRAMAEMNGQELDGRTIKVDEAEDKRRNGGGGGGFGGRGGGGGYGGGGGGYGGGGGGGGYGGGGGRGGGGGYGGGGDRGGGRGGRGGGDRGGGGGGRW